ncbi:PINIT domain-containing protein [Lasiosphaeria miniovina]|uniref:PINIT domain-containing protein n=1 Tax=Lasiosphaeria miniovina TaxID=1954250 RepID=A0AA40DKK2_9PEZI|nr:PINIT domain-containing protein [Lasiosphaeria miniovina]KAK0703233.1 PINIT domain-containing protein [Lasiosphaeria miniovina]
MAGPSEQEIQRLICAVQIPSIQKATLQSICSVNGLPKTGNKIDLQNRIINWINTCAGDVHRFREVSQSLASQSRLLVPQLTPSMPPPMPAPMSPPMPAPMSPRMPPQETPFFPTPSTLPASPHYPLWPYKTALPGSPHYPLSAYNTALGNGLRPSPPQPPSQAPAPGSPNQFSTLQFMPSPFYDVLSRIGDIKTCEVITQYRNKATMKMKPQDHLYAVQQLTANPTMRAMLFCSAGNRGIQDITFPDQAELKVNGGRIKANLRGVKNKPGSTRPVDITDSLRLKPALYINNIEFTYAMRNEKFFLSLFLCMAKPVEHIIRNITLKIQKESVVTEIAKKASDPDVVATAQNLSLKCPLSYMRLNLPCRALSCSHIQCFDATSYLQLQEQGPQWICPICNNPAPFDQLAVDEYIREILAKTPKTVEQVTIELDGKWSVPSAKNETASAANEASILDSDDLTVLEISGVSNRTSTATPNRGAAPASAHTTGVSSTPSMSKSRTKRPAPGMIDLTQSDDDEPPALPEKRPNYGHSVFAPGVFGNRC